MSPSETKPVEWVTASELRREFNDGGYWERAQANELVALRKKSTHRNPPGEPYCTRSELVCYYTHSAELVAIVHQYRRPDNTIGAGGRPDPKRLVLADKILAVRSAPKNE